MTEILHASWLPSSSRIFVWGESGDVAAARRSSASLAHPYQTSLEQLCHLAAGAGLRAPETATETVWLPAIDRHPLPSPELAATGRQTGRTGVPSLAFFRVHGLSLPVLTAIDLLLGLPGAQDQGSDWRAWRTASLLALEVVARQELIPIVVSGPSKQTAQWRPLPGPAIRAKLETLAQSLPPIARAVVEAAEASPPPRQLLWSFIGEAVDAAVRRAVADGGREIPTILPSPGGEWLAALTATRSSAVKLTGNRAEGLQDAWQRWAAPATAGENEAFRITFRLEPPNDSDRPWKLVYLLQAIDDPSLILPASDLWQAGGDAHWLFERIDQPHERFLTGLGYASRLIPRIEASLRQRAPDHAEISIEEAFTFLKETASLLEESGFGVQLPGWWSGKGARLKARGKARGRSSSNDSRGLLSFASLVDFDWQVTLGDETVEPEEFYRLAALKQPLVQLRGQWIALEPDAIAAGLRLLEKGSTSLSLADFLRIGLDPQGTVPGIDVAGVEPEGWLRDVLERLKGDESAKPEPLPAGLRAEMRPYQHRGYDWLAFLHRFGLGACLADDMGLGKTLQTIAYLERQRENGQTSPALVVCPTSVVGNWQRELTRFAPNLRVAIHHGSNRRQKDAFIDFVQNYDVVMTSYPLLTRDTEILKSIDWSSVVLDEAQNIKNASTKQAQAARLLNAGFRIALSGTPVENRLSDLWSIMTFLNPGYLGSEESFRKEFARPIERGSDAAAIERLRRLTSGFILRRLKTDPKVIADLPEKFEAKVYCPLTKEQATLYEAVVRDALDELDNEETSGIQRRGQVLAMLTKLKQVTNHPALFLHDGTALPGRSGKLERLNEMLEEVVSAGDRALIFTQFASMGELLQQYLSSTLDREILFLHGATKSAAREEMVQRFQAPHGPPVFILSLKAGGMGLNLTAASTVFHFDRWWNPAVENQATDRAFRIGQTKNVQVYKFLCGGTLEERIDEMIENKRSLAENVVGSGEQWLTELSTSELRDLVALRREDVAEVAV